MTRQQIYETIDVNDFIFAKIRNEPTAADAWNAICRIYETKNTQNRLMEIQCGGINDIELYF